MVKKRYREEKPNPQGRYFIPPLGVELGHWEGECRGNPDTYVRVWFPDGRIVPTLEERLAKTQSVADRGRKLRKKAETDAIRLADKLRSLGFDPDS